MTSMINGRDLHADAPLLSSHFLRGPSGSGMTVTYKPSPTSFGFISNGRDSGALPRLRDIILPAWSHGSLRELGENLGKAFAKPSNGKPDGALIIGHGAPGYFDAGDGAWNDTDEGSIQLRNEEIWGPYFERLRTPPILSDRGNPRVPPVMLYRSIFFLSCSTASGRGRLLMQRIADIGGLAVRAHVGLIFVYRHYYVSERGSGNPWCIPSDASDLAREHYRPDRDWEEPLQPSNAVKGLRPEMVAFFEDTFTGLVRLLIKTPRSGDEIELTGSDAERVLMKTLSVGPFRKDGDLIGSCTLTLTVERQGVAPLTIELVSNRLAVTSDGLAFFVDLELRAELLRHGLEY